MNKIIEIINIKIASLLICCLSECIEVKNYFITFDVCDSNYAMMTIISIN